MRNRLTTSVVLLLVLFFYSIDSSASTVASGRVIYQVIDEINAPVVGVKFSGGGWIPDGSQSSEFSAISDSKGMAVVNVRTAMDMGGEITKDGFYRSSFHYMFAGKGEEAVLKGRWQPWGITNVVVLKHIRNPIPMYVKRVDAEAPKLGAPVGYDLEKGDWVAPHGKGVTHDLIFNVTGEYRSIFEADLEMTATFRNMQDGIQSFTVQTFQEEPSGSLLISRHEAPLEGYNSQYHFERYYRKKRGESINVNERFGLCQYFRVRTKVDDEGKIVKALYGKMYGDFFCHFDFDKKIWVSFTYYLNPTPNDRNVEFDPKRNIFKWSRREYRQQNFRP